MRKMFSLMAVAVIGVSSFGSLVAFTNKPGQESLLTPSVKNNVGQTNESSQAIANKLLNKTIVLNYPQWKDLQFSYYAAEFRKVIVEQGILTAAEAKYVYPNPFFFREAKVYHYNGVYVEQPGERPTYVKNVNIDVTTTDTLQQIAQKLNSETLQFNLDYWKNKSVKTYLYEIQNILVKDKILSSAAEAKLVYGVVNDQIIKKTGDFQLNFNLGNGFRVVGAHININVVDDGNSAYAILNKLKGKTVKLPADFWYGKNTKTYQKNFKTL